MEQQTLKRLIQARGRLKATITRLVNYIENPPPQSTYSGVDAMLARLNQAFRSLEEITDEMHLYDNVEGFEDPTEDFQSYEEKYLRALTLFASLKSELQPSAIPQADHNMATLLQQQSEFLQRLAENGASTLATPPPAAVCLNENPLPKIHIKPFGGDYKEWPAFKDIYESTVHNKTHLGKIQKFHYLKSFIVGEAGNLLSHMSITESAYDSAWERLNDRYDRPRHIVNSLLDTFMALAAAPNGEVSNLRKLSDGANEIIRGLDAVGETSRDCWVIHLVLAKIVPDSRRKWIEDTRGSATPTVADLFRFLDDRCEDFELSQATSAIKLDPGSHTDKPAKAKRALIAVNRGNCSKCGSADHQLYRCSQFQNLNTEHRRSFVKGKSLCFNCLRPGHRSSQCQSKHSCKHCKGRHHSLVHPENMDSVTVAPADTAQASPQTSGCSSTLVAQTQNSNSLTQSPGLKRSTLPTALVYVQNSKGTYTICRVLLDSGSELSYVSERCINALGLARSPSRILVSGISSVKAETTRGLATLHIKSMVSLHTIVVAAHVLGKITSTLQRDDIDETALRIYDGLQLADTSFNTSSPVDILLGNEQIWSVLSGDKKYDTDGNIIAISSIFGWIITSVAMPQPLTANTLMTTVDINASLQRFWEIEDNTEHTQRDPAHEKVEQHFLTTHSRDPDGKYIVELPFKHECQEFGDTLQGAVSRFYAVERRLQRDMELRKLYSKFMSEYLSLGHMRKLPPEECNTSAKTFYMPHHPVLGKKLRVVFDGSYEDVNGHALNDALHIGPSIQRNLFHVCLRFRMHKFVFSADIVKMFRQIWVAPKHRNFQRIVWREAPKDPLQHFQLCTVTYGTSCAPFLAVRVLEQLARDHQDEFPTASKIVLEDFYVDDVLTGAETEDELLSRRDELIQLMSRAKLELGKWVSNSSVIRHIRQDELQITSAVKVLGMLWNPQDDVLSYKASLSTEPDATKRQVLSDVSRIFDPLGILAPVVVQFKILFQELWLLDLDWDSKLPPKLAEWWQTCRDDINYITNLRIPRYVHSEPGKIELHGFSDASIKAYAAVVYSRVSNADGTCLVSLMAAKTRVAPLKQQSLPRLELCGELLLTRLLRAVKEGLHHKDIVVHAWCDSTIVLSWLSHTPSKLKTFIANRTSEILDVIPRSAWHHVGSKDNPADCASRGMLAANLMSYELWWKGPHWLHLNDLLASKLRSGNNLTTILDTPIMDELKSSSLSSRVESEPEASPIECLSFRVSSWTKLIRCTAYVLRQAQGSFSSDLHLLQRGKAVANSSTLRTLSPMVCKNGLLRVGGRLSNSLLPEEIKHPIILPKHHRISLLILEHEHRIHLHPGVTALFVIVRQQYWIVGARNMIRKLTHACLKCFRQRHKTTDQYMADLPAVRVRQAYPFENTGCDYAGPLLLKVHKGRNPRKEKGYICLFVCLVTSAIHLELATDLSTDTFLAALRRFTSRRGKCTHIFSDNGRNFVGAKKVLDEMYKLILSQQHNTQVTQALASEGIKWSFIPPHAPHWGGKWESAVRSVKLHLRRVIGNSILTFEQMHTLLAQIESVVNSRPLFATSDIEVSYLSPAHLLIGRPYTSLPEGDLGHIAVNRLDYWQNVQAMLQGFWKRWHQEYLTTLQQRPKWNTERKNIAPGDMAIIKDSNTPPAAWTLARIIEVYPGKDGLVRAVKLRTSSGELVRPISKIAILPNSET
ncbi:uncharacterized protein LOC122320328 [Drosophila ficusphila]|uniref:uncharacterized protein LOC122320328 n=1 Tax=Drosophila ficusphila TaxID=30025 RepID=UPI001C8AAFC6|nr:uncharacterized protein LOC122320328 [Drosophila ficusphila]